LLIMLAVALGFAHGVNGWHWNSLNEMRVMLPFRLPRLLAAIAAGVLLAAAGVIFAAYQPQSYGKP
jgi:hypothetical protein